MSDFFFFSSVGQDLNSSLLMNTGHLQKTIVLLLTTDPILNTVFYFMHRYLYTYRHIDVHARL